MSVDITKFLPARIAEDEAVARAGSDEESPDWGVVDVPHEGISVVSAGNDLSYGRRLPGRLRARPSR